MSQIALFYVSATQINAIYLLNYNKKRTFVPALETSCDGELSKRELT